MSLFCGLSGGRGLSRQGSARTTQAGECCRDSGAAVSVLAPAGAWREPISSDGKRPDAARAVVLPLGQATCAASDAPRGTPRARRGGTYAEESWDGRYLYYIKQDPGFAIWRFSVDGGDETEVVSEPDLAWRGLAVSRSGLYHSRWRRGVYTIRFLDFESGQVTDHFRTDGDLEWRALAVSPDEKWLLYNDRPPLQSELMLVENFR